MKRLELMRSLDDKGPVKNEVWEGDNVAWKIEQMVFRVWNDEKTLVVPLDKIYSITIYTSKRVTTV